MKQIKMSDMETRGLHIPGGWYARVPQISADDKSMAAYTGYFQQVYGWPPMQARAIAAATLQAAFEHGFIRQLRLSIQRWAKLYQRKFPDAYQLSGTLKGFDPGLMQNAYIPGENTGRRGKHHVKTLMREMWENANG